jgi:hypothetical protein
MVHRRSGTVGGFLWRRGFDRLFEAMSRRPQGSRPVTEHPTPDPAEATADEKDAPTFNAEIPHATPERPLSDVARRALLEAAERRTAQEAAAAATEYGGPTGPEPTRYGDWEKKGLAVDF